MAATAYAALVSLMNTMDQIMVHPFLSTCFDNSHFASLREMVDFLVKFVEKYSDAMIPEEEDDMLADADSIDLLSRIAVAAQTAEDIIEVEAAQNLSLSTEENRGYSHDMPEMIQAMDFLKKEVVMKVKKEGRIFKDEERTPKASMAPLSSSSSSASPAAAKTNKMVGFDDHLNQLLDRLTSDQPCRQIIPIVGMGGIGKTTLARNAYQNPLTVERFDHRVWVVVSQVFTRRNILLQALSYLSPKGSTGERETYATDDHRLGDELRKILFGRRYLIVLDDVWSMEAWEEIMRFFPDNENRSRIVVTTRQRDVVSHSDFSSPLVVKFLDEKSSWELFCDKAFAQKDCPPELQGAGKEIVEKCGGLPLAITVVGGLLGKSPMTPEYWEKIAQDKSQFLEAGSGEGNKILSILYTMSYKHLPAYLKSCFGGFDGEDSRRENKVLNILYLSYKHLPVYLKSCFLCIGLFPEYHKINKPQLIQLWIAQGFIKAADNSSTCQSLEEIAESYIMNLVDRNLLLVENYSVIGDRVYICYLHDVVRELCLRVAEKEKFHRVQRDIDGRHRFIADEGNARWFYPQECLGPSLIRPLIVEEQREREGAFRSRLLRVFAGDIGCLNHFQLVNLRFFMVTDDNSSYSPPSQAIRVMPAYCSLAISISLCWSLQTFIMHVSVPVVAPPHIWSMPQLKHVDVRDVIQFHDPHEDDAPVIVLHNLQTLKRVSNLNLSKEMTKRIPNIKELEIGYNFKDKDGATLYLNLQNLGCFNKLEILRYLCTGTECLGDDDKLQRLKLPTSLKELTLTGCRLLGSDMAIIALLPSLQFLNFFGTTVVDKEKEWNFEHDGGFPCLEHLHIAKCDDLVSWGGDGSSFPVLKSFCLEHLSKLQGIPLGIGERPTLISIIVNDCCEQVIMSAVEILKDHEENDGNESLTLQLHFKDTAEADEWKDRIAHEMKFKSKQLRISRPVASTDNDSHSWVSTHVPGYSWVPIESTTC